MRVNLHFYAGNALELLADCAQRAERLRAAGATVVFVTGSEVSLFTRGFFPGHTIGERLALLADAQTSGGLLVAVAPEAAGALIDALRRRGTLAHAAIGCIVDGPAGCVTIA